MAKPKPEKVKPYLAREALFLAKDTKSAWSEYIRQHYRHTGDLAPGCDAKDFFEWVKQNPESRHGS
jgi:hypothetical protein